MCLYRCVLVNTSVDPIDSVSAGLFCFMLYLSSLTVSGIVCEVHRGRNHNCNVYSSDPTKGHDTASF